MKIPTGTGMFQSERLSLRQRLLLWLLPPIIVLTAIWIWAAYVIVIRFANVAYDNALSDTVETLAEQVIVDHETVRIDLPKAARKMVEYDRIDQIYYSITDQRGKNFFHNADIPARQANADRGSGMFLPDLPHLYDSRIDGQPVRVAERVVPGSAETGKLTLRVAETLGKRALLAREVLFYMSAPQLLFLTGIVVFVWVGVGRGIAPLQWIRDAISRRSPDDLSPLDGRTLPAEVHAQVRAINGLMARLDAMLDVQRRFITDAAHQLRTPVATLRAQVELALRARDPAEREAGLQRLDATSKHLVRLTNQLLDLSRATAGNTGAVEMLPFDIADAVRETVAWFVPDALDKGIEVSVELDEDLPPLRGNRHMIEQMLANLVDNAVRYNRRGGTILVEGRRERDRLVLTIRDDGPGIAEKDRSRVLGRFHRGAGSPSGGSGLGLAIALEICRLHGGELSLNPIPGQTGLVVRVEMPFDPPAPRGRGLGANEPGEVAA